MGRVLRHGTWASRSQTESTGGPNFGWAGAQTGDGLTDVPGRNSLTIGAQIEDDDHYAKYCKSLRIETRDIIKLNDSIGLHPVMKEAGELSDEEMKATVDFRSIYASLLQGWLETEATGPLGGSFEPLSVVR